MIGVGGYTQYIVVIAAWDNRFMSCLVVATGRMDV